MAGRGTVNKVILIGRLGADPELKYTGSGAAVANLSIATNFVWKDQEGNQHDKTEWHRVVVWRKLAEIVGEYVKKGSRIYVEGRLETRSWEDQNGVKRYTTEVVADSIELLDSKREAAPTESAAPTPPDIPDEAPQEDDLPF